MELRNGGIAGIIIELCNGIDRDSNLYETDIIPIMVYRRYS